MFGAVPSGSTGHSLFDETVFFVGSEFSRTIGLNGQNGKDHNTKTNSILLAGGGISGGRAIGASRILSFRGNIEQVGVGYDFRNGAVIERRPELQSELQHIDVIYPENVIRTITDLFGVTDKIRSVSSKTRPLIL